MYVSFRARLRREHPAPGRTHAISRDLPCSPVAVQLLDLEGCFVRGEERSELFSAKESGLVPIHLRGRSRKGIFLRLEFCTPWGNSNTKAYYGAAADVAVALCR